MIGSISLWERGIIVLEYTIIFLKKYKLLSIQRHCTVKFRTLKGHHFFETP